ncbi:MAG: RpiB/LacA/LacB family sugar-phosphate isomerase, partial [bacterium]
MPKLITEEDVFAAKKAGKDCIEIESNTIITPLARDAVKSSSMSFTIGAQNKQTASKEAARPPFGVSKGPIAIGADHGGFELKNVLASFLRSEGYTVNDLGCFSPDPVDYPDVAHLVAETVAKNDAAFGIIIDGAGVGSAIVANKVPGIRAACCNDLFNAANSREHNGANVLTLGGRIIGEGLAKKIVLT